MSTAETHDEEAERGEESTADPQAVLAARWEATGELRREWREDLSTDFTGRLVGINLGLGAWGVISGCALYVLAREQMEEHSWWVFLLALTVAAFVAWLTENVRERIDYGHTHPVGMQLPVTILTLGMFELFISAWHGASEAHRQQWVQAGLVLLGDELSLKLTAPWAMMALLALWVVIGAGLAAFLGTMAFQCPMGAADNLAAMAAPMRRCALYSAAAGAAAGAVGVLVTALAVRVIGSVYLMMTQPDQWVASAQELARSGHWMTWLLLRPIDWLCTLWKWKPMGPLLTVGTIVALWWTGKEQKNWVPLGIVLAGLGVIAVSPVLGQVRLVLWMMLAAAIVWAIPGLVLGASVPLLKGAAQNQGLWTAAALLAAAVLAMATCFHWHQPGLLLPAEVTAGCLMVLGAIVFWKGGSVRRYWPLSAMVLAVLVMGGTSVQYATFEGVLDSLSALTEGAARPTIMPDQERQSGPNALRHVRRWDPEPIGAMGLNLDRNLQSPWLSSQKPSPLGQWNSPAVLVPDFSDIALHRLRSATAAADTLVKQGNEALGRQGEQYERDRDWLKSLGKEVQTRQQELKNALNQYVQLRSSEAAAKAGQIDHETEVCLRKMSILEHYVQLRLGQVEGIVHAPGDKRDASEIFEVAVTGSFGFWVTVGLLVNWSTRTHEPRIVKGKDGKHRCFWANGALTAYHDGSYGRRPVNDRELFERLCLEMLGPGAFANVEKVREAAQGFVPEQLTAVKVEDLVRKLAMLKLGGASQQEGNRLVQATRAILENARRVSEYEKQHGIDSSGTAILEDWAAKAQSDPEGLVKEIRRWLVIPAGTPLGSLLLGAGLAPGAHYKGCDVGDRAAS